MAEGAERDSDGEGAIAGESDLDLVFGGQGLGSGEEPDGGEGGLFREGFGESPFGLDADDFGAGAIGGAFVGGVRDANGERADFAFGIDVTGGEREGFAEFGGESGGIEAGRVEFEFDGGERGECGGGQKDDERLAFAEGFVGMDGAGGGDRGFALGLGFLVGGGLGGGDGFAVFAEFGGGDGGSDEAGGVGGEEGGEARLPGVVGGDGFGV